MSCPSSQRRAVYHAIRGLWSLLDTPMLQSRSAPPAALDTRPPSQGGAPAAGYRLQEDGALPEWRPQGSTWTGRPAGQRRQLHEGDGPRRVRGLVDHAEGHPPAAEEKAEPEQAEAGVPEPPDAIVPAAPLLQEGRDVGERRRRSHKLSSSPQLGRRDSVPRGPRTLLRHPSDGGGQEA